ncbi:MAG: metallophosphoesterase, partial [Enterococcus sp.]|nr:metallophosphoesterase [Enterococcus sp.]
PLGYYYEWQLTRDFVFEHHLVEKYRPTKLRTILRQNQTAFTQQKERFLLDEFQRSLTLIPY